jgi:hypothetical protein
MSPQRKEEMTIDGCLRGSRRSHNQKRETSRDASRRSSQEKLDRELVEIKVQLEVMEEFVQRNMEEQRYGWVLRRKRIKWIQLKRRLMYDTRVQLEEELREAELQQRMCAEEEVYLCELEQGSTLDESSDEDEDMRIYGGFMNSWKDGNQLEELMFETTKEASKPYDFETNN